LKAFERIVESAESLIDFLWRTEAEADDLATPERRAAVRQRLFDHAREIEDPGVQQLYKTEFKARFDAKFVERRSKSFGSTTGYTAVRGASPEMKRSAAEMPRAKEVRALLAGLLHYPEAADLVGEEIAGLDIEDASAARLRAGICRAISANPALDKSALRDDLARRGLGQLAEEVMASNRLAFGFTRPRTPAAAAAEELACVARHLTALAALDDEDAELRLRYATLTQDEFDRRRELTTARKEIEDELRLLAQGRRLAAEEEAAANARPAD
ncbi:MAG: DNA primase, partial [Pacificimonas sp.]